jgi:hypothetical protein
MVKCPGLAEGPLERSPIQEPDDNVRSIFHQANLVICRPQTLELVRRMLSDYDQIVGFFVKSSDFLSEIRGCFGTQMKLN